MLSQQLAALLDEPPQRGEMNWPKRYRHCFMWRLSPVYSPEPISVLPVWSIAASEPVPFPTCLVPTFGVFRSCLAEDCLLW